jgi:tRNA (guanine37-N1)-methyltransferase
VILKLVGYDDVETAKELVGFEFAVPEQDRVPLPADHYYDWELEGCTVKAGDTNIGKVRSVIKTGGTEILEVVDEDGKERLIPLVDSIVVEIDPAGKTIVVDPPEGLLDLTIFPEFFDEVIDCGILRRARNAGLVEVKAHDLRQWTTDKHHVVDDRPFGGGDGMILKPEPIFAGVEALTGASRKEDLPAKTRVMLLSAQGEVFSQALAQDISQNTSHVILLCGRYEGVDERVAQALVTDEVSIGDYVLSGGEPAAVVVVDAVVRLLPGALGSETSAVYESFSEGLLDHPQYTRPPEFRGMKVPDVLLSGNHAEIERWRKEAAIEKTRRKRPDLLK